MRRFAATLTFTLCATGLIASDARGQDSDGDGFPDAVDGLPCDGFAAGFGFSPAEGTPGMVMFEDQWPARGDHDFNDVVLAYNVLYALTPTLQVRAVAIQLDPIALGGAFDNGLGLTLPVPASAAQYIDRVRLRPLGPPPPIDSDEAALPPPPMPEGPPVGIPMVQSLSPLPGESNLTVIVSDNLRELFGGLTGPINSIDGAPAIMGDSLVIDIGFSTPVDLPMSDAPYDLFIFRTGDPTLEVHRPSFGGSTRLASHRLGTQDDRSTPGRFFVDQGGVPYSLTFPTPVAYPREGRPISSLYPAIVAFGSSGGTQFTDFYTIGSTPSEAYVGDGSGPTIPVPIFLPPPMIYDTSCIDGSPPPPILH